jgi:hypothetical protein
MVSQFLESLELRRLLSVAAPTAGPTLTAVRLPSAVTRFSTVLVGTTINAETNQAFRAVIGTIRRLGPLPSGYTLHGDIDWGDGTAMSEAQFVTQADGSIAVLGDHTYSTVGTDDIRVVVSAVPPPWSEAPVRLIGNFHSKANVIASNGGVTLEETAGVSFTENVGFFRSTIDSATMSAVIEWSDGTQTPGKIAELPTAGPVPTFAVAGSHDYSATGSYLAHVTVYSSYPSPIVGPMPPVILVAQIDSVIDVLPPPTTAAALAFRASNGLGMAKGAITAITQID